jgi:hypothetical protein
MSRYRVRVQIIEWYELVISADSIDGAVDIAESMRPSRIRLFGKRLRDQTGLADFNSVKILEDP